MVWVRFLLPLPIFLKYNLYGGCGEVVNTSDCDSDIAWVRFPSAAPFNYDCWAIAKR
ncbi:hypothetical protein BTS2_2989 [Bacillus sp. TS-2]|nr:hypothetical protein BTS2_2989 [Bacillus sp. TS-2]